MRTLREIETLLERLDECVADDLEDQDLDFKEWGGGDKASFRKAVDWAICMANGGGGVVVFGVADKVKGRAQAILGVPPEVDVHRLKRAVYDGTDPKLTPVIEEILVPEGTGRLVAMFVYDGIPPYTDTAGRGLVRVGKDCKPLTGSLRRKLEARWTADDYTAETVSGRPDALISAAAMEGLRTAAAAENAPGELLALTDDELLTAVGVQANGRLTRAALMLAGSEAALREHAPNYLWTHLRMRGELDYTDRADGNSAIPVAISRLRERIGADNPIETIRRGPYHFEYRTYPEVAVREALMNALCHADHRIASPILVKQYQDRIEMTNAGGLLGNATPDNILHHAPETRNPCLVGALVRLRLVNRSTLGMHRIYSHFLMEGKAPPRIDDRDGVFRIEFRAAPVSAPFRFFVAEEATERGVVLTLDHLLVLHRLVSGGEIGTTEAARLCQRSPSAMSQILSRMADDLGYVERYDDGDCWGLTVDLSERLTPVREPGPISDGEWATAKAQVAGIMRRRAGSPEDSLSNADVRRITGLSRRQVHRMIHELVTDGRVRIAGQGRAARYLWVG